MAIPAGLAAQLGYKKETTYGTRVVPNQFAEFNSEGVQLKRNRIMSKGLRAGRTFQRSSRVATPTRAAEGPVAFEFVNKGMGFWLDLLHGNVVTPVQQGATTAYLQTHNIGTTDAGKSATVQAGKPGTDGTVRPFDYLGCMVTEATLSCKVDEFLEAEFGLDVQDRKTDQALAVASYPASLETFHFAQAAVSVNSVNVTDVFTDVALKMSFSRKTDRFFLGSAGLHGKPILNDYNGATIDLGGEFKDLTNLALYDADTVFPVVLSWTSATLAGTAFPFALTITMSACQITGDDPTVGGPDVLDQGISLNVMDDGTNPPIVITYMSTDTAAL
jgi:hypothetical protein